MFYCFPIIVEFQGCSKILLEKINGYVTSKLIYFRTYNITTTDIEKQSHKGHNYCYRNDHYYQ